MGKNGNSSARVRFAFFELNVETGELRKHGRPVRLQPQPSKVLAALVSRPGELVTRQELRDHIWDGTTFVDFEHGLNFCIRQIRLVLNDDAESPRFVETVRRRGYRFIAGIELMQVASAGSTKPCEEEGPARHSESNVGTNSRKRWPLVGGAILVGAASLLGSLLLYRASRPRAEFTMRAPVPFSVLLGRQSGPTFSPDGSHLAFTWDGNLVTGSKGRDLYVKAIGSETLLRLTQHPSPCLDAAWSPDGTQIAFHRISGSDTGVYVVPALGGAERRLRSTHMLPSLTCLTTLSWSPDGKWIAFVDSLPSGENRIHHLSVETLAHHGILWLAGGNRMDG